MLECSGLSQPLFVVTGSCHGIEITLDTYHIPFGPVVLQSQSTRRVLLMNTGDIGARYEHQPYSLHILANYLELIFYINYLLDTQI